MGAGPTRSAGGDRKTHTRSGRSTAQHMDPIRFSLHRPVAVTVCVLLVVMFGLIGLSAIPIQLTPTVDRPIVTVTTNWPGRSPEEVVDEITKEQEKRLKNVSNLKSMRTTSREGQCEVSLEFYLGTDITRALQEVSDALRQVPRYPEEVDEPVIKSSEGAAESAIAWIIIDVDPAHRHKHPDYDVSTLFNAMDREVKPYLERVGGVAEVNIYGGREREVHVLADPVRLAQRGLSHADVVQALRTENRNISAGSIEEGKRDYRVRIIGQFETEEDVRSTIVAYREGRPVFVRDVAEVRFDYQRARGFVRSMGEPCLAMNVIRQSGSNVMTIMADVRQRLDEVSTEILPRLDPVVGPDLRIRQVYDETVYIDSAIDLVLNNLWKGGLLATLVLLTFLRSLKSTFIIALAIPVSIIGTFLVMVSTGRTLNVVSLAGLAFATGMVVDNAVVVLENIDRRRRSGEKPLTAVYNGAKEVWTAILGSTLTTIAVFIPILTIQEEVGQLFFDLSLALAASVTLSLIIAITVVPCAASLLLGAVPGAAAGTKPRTPNRFYAFFTGVTLVVRRVMLWTITSWRGWTVRPLLIVAMTTLSIWGSLRLMPPMDYLPAGNQNLVFGGLLVPPGLSVTQMNAYADAIDQRVGPYLLSNLKSPEDVRNLPPIPNFFGPPLEPVGVANYFVGSFQGGMFCGAISADPQRVIPVGVLLTGAMNGMPDAFGGAFQSSIFGRGVGGGGNNIELEISGPDLARVVNAAQMCYGLAGQLYGFGMSVTPNPSNFDKSQPEWRLRLNNTGRELGLRTEDLGLAARALFDGAFAGDFRLGGRNVDLLVMPRGGRLEYKEQLLDIPVSTPLGRMVPVSTIATLEPSRAPQQVYRVEELPSVTIQVRPPAGRALEEIMGELREQVIEPARRAGLIDPTMRVRLEGTAAKLDEVKGALFGQGGKPLTGLGASLLNWAALAVLGAGLALGVVGVVRAAKRRQGSMAYGGVGAVLISVLVAVLFVAMAMQPQLITARFIWALLVTYFIMCALFESFLYPLVIMFSVPLAVVGGFGALRIVHEWTMANPNIAAQQLDVLTMIGFVVLIGVVVNNAILIVEQSLNFMNPDKAGLDGERAEALPPPLAIAESVRTRIRPIFMTTFTTLGGGLPLVIAPGEGSEMYRGLGAVIVGGLLVSTFFTLVLVPLTFSMVYEMKQGFAAIFARVGTPVPAGVGASTTAAHLDEKPDAERAHHQNGVKEVPGRTESGGRASTESKKPTDDGPVPPASAGSQPATPPGGTPG